MILTHKTEIFPSKDQKTQIEINFGLRRFFFNKVIMTLKHRYGDLKENKKLIKKKEVLEIRSNVIRKQYKHLCNLGPAQIMDTTMEDVNFALDSLWKKGKDIKLRKKKDSNTFRICRSGCKPDGSSSSFHVEPSNKKYIRLPRLGYLKMAEELRWEVKPTTIRTATIKRYGDRYFISITCEIDNPKPLPKTNRSLGIDWGIKCYITAFDGDEVYECDFDNDKLTKLDKQIAKCNKSLARKKRFSMNWNKAKNKLIQAHLNFVNYRMNEINDMVSLIVKSYDSVTLEDLGMSFVTRNRRLANAARRKPYYLLKVALINKFSQYGKKVYLVDKSFPSTQTCYQCGNVKKGDDKMKLGESVYHCDHCGYTADRDHNAAMNIWSSKDVKVATLD